MGMRWVVVGVAALLVGLLAYGVASEGSKTAADSRVQPGKVPPETRTNLTELGGERTGSVSSYRGKFVLVNFWASWCPPCTAELPLLQKAQRAIESGGGTVLGINSRDNTEDALRWVRDKRLTYPSLRDGSGDFSDEWGVRQLPETYLLGKDGRIKAFLKGELTQAWIDENVLPLVKTR